MLSGGLERAQIADFSRIVDDSAVRGRRTGSPATLVKTLPWTFHPDYAEWLAAARARLTPNDLDEPADGQ
ncbi:hypothetical protein ABZ806_35080 [Spirillospora sp. NPDC047418]